MKAERNTTSIYKCTFPGADPGFVVRGGVSRLEVWEPLKVPSGSKAEPWQPPGSSGV